MPVRPDWCGSQFQAFQQLCFANTTVQVGSAWTNSISEIYFISVFGSTGMDERITVNSNIRAEVKHDQ